MPPRKYKPLKLYISAIEDSIASLLAQDNEEGYEQSVFYLSRVLQKAECNYPMIEKLCLALYITSMKLRHNLLSHVLYIMAQTDVVKYMLSRPMVKGKIGKWSLTLLEFDLVYVSQKVVKDQTLVDFQVDHPYYPIQTSNEDDCITLTSWQLYFNGSKTKRGSRVGIVIVSPRGIVIELSFRLEGEFTNNQAEYEAFV